MKQEELNYKDQEVQHKASQNKDQDLKVVLPKQRRSQSPELQSPGLKLEIVKPEKKEKIRVLQQIDTASFGGDDVPHRGKLYDIIENTSTENLSSSAKMIQTHHSKVTSLENAESLVTKESKKNQGQTDELVRKTTFGPAAQKERSKTQKLKKQESRGFCFQGL